VTGWYAYDFGRSALEASYSAELAGSASSQTVDRLVDLFTGATPVGATVQTTINPKLQQIAAAATRHEEGAVVAIDPKTGAILAMVTTPRDPNTLAAMTSPPRGRRGRRSTPMRRGPLADRGTREIYPPGSTFKLIHGCRCARERHGPDTMVDTPRRSRCRTPAACSATIVAAATASRP